MSWYQQWRPYVPVARRKAQAALFAAKLAKKENRTLSPVKLEGRKIAHSFWGQAWCDNLEAYSDYDNRLPRGRTYVRNGSVIDLQIDSGRIKALVSGSEVYRITIDIDTLTTSLWKRIKQDCAQSIDSLIDLLQGRFDQGVMGRLTQPKDGLFPQPREIKMKCSCPDWAGLCKHLAAVLYAVGARLDTDPEMLFKLRNVDHLELVGTAVAAGNLERTLAGNPGEALTGDLGEIFGIELEPGASSEPKTKTLKRKAKGPKVAAAAPSSHSQARSEKAATKSARPAKASSPKKSSRAASARMKTGQPIDPKATERKG